MFLTAPETKNKTLEEMDEVFDSGRPAWRTVPRGSRLDQLEMAIGAGNLKVVAPVGRFSSRELKDDKLGAEHDEWPLRKGFGTETRITAR